MNEAGNKRSLRRRPLIEEIEPRILYSSDAGPLTAMAIIAQHRSVDSAGEFVSQASAQVSPAAPAQARHEIVFVETNTPHYQQLIEGIKSQSAEQRQIDVVLLDPQADGINQISAALAGQTDVTAVHLISHGADGQVRLGA